MGKKKLSDNKVDKASNSLLIKMKSEGKTKKTKEKEVDTNELDSLFLDLKDIKRAKQMREIEEKAEEEEEDYGPPLVPHTGKTSADKLVAYGLIKPDNGMILPSPEAPLERMQDGVAVYKAHLLKVGEGGGTPLCPFDCACCF